MDNIYNSDAFFKVVYNHEKQLLNPGVMTKGMKGIPPCVTQKHILIPWGHQMQKLWKGIQNAPKILKLVCITPSLSTALVWFHKSQSWS